ncbi:MAG: sigma-70 family RNA polymerase sigma factor [Sedimentisphaerales bacterium]|nr:sigma-70 family RNA polymerase sigma factor [Sedimentisphaerales bacterium]
MNCDTAGPPDRASQFISLYMAYQTKIRGYILCLVGNWADADDILQQTALVMWRKFRPPESDRQFLHWALRIAHYEVTNHAQRKGNHLPLFSQEVMDQIEAKAARAVEHQDLISEALQACIRLLRERDKELLRLRYEVGATVAGVAASVGRSIDAVYKALNRIHYQLLICIRRKLAQTEQI